jgi:uncharacterized protein YbcI
VASPVVTPPSVPRSGSGIAQANAPKVEAPTAPLRPESGARSPRLTKFTSVRHGGYRGSRYSPLSSVAVGIGLIIFALDVPSASRLVLVVGGVAIVSGIVTGISRLRDRAAMADLVWLARQVLLIHCEYYGQEPARVRAFEAGDVIVVLVEGTFTRAEQTLIERGDASEVQVIRRRFETAIADQFIEIVQTATGRYARTFLPDTDLREQIAIETFVLGEPLGDLDETQNGPQTLDI